MNKMELARLISQAGRNMNNDQIRAIGQEAAEKFGINKDELMLLLISGKPEFINMIKASL